VFAGIRLSSQVNIVIVSITIVSLLAFVAAGMADFEAERLQFKFELPSLLEASALMFVAFTGYGRIATLGEEVVDPRRTIPRAIIATLLISMAIYLAVAAAFVGGPARGLATVATSKIVQAAPLENAARSFSIDVHWLVALGAMTAMLGVLLNLLLGLSRVMLAMGRRGDMPRRLSNLGAAVVAVGTIIAALAATGSVKQTWSFSAFTVLIYYAVTNLAALRLSRADRLYSPAWAVGGLAACVALAFSIELKVAAAGGAILAIGLAWHWLRRRSGQSA
jgi:APA family basic amino acid/polyamine antiporter